MTKRRTKLHVFAALSVSLALIGCRGSDDDDADVATEDPTETAATDAVTDTATEDTATEATEAASTEATTATEDTGSSGTEGTSAGTAGEAPSAPEVDCPESEPGLTDTEITLGGSYPLSGPVAAYGVIPVAIKAWFDYLNETEGGITAGDGVTRRINWTYLDDQYQPPRTLENVRRLVEQDNVWLVFNPLGTPPNVAIRDYLNGAEVPQLFVATGASMWGNQIDEYPWTIGYQPDYESEGIAYAQYALSENPDARVGVLYANDDFGRDYLTGIREGMGDAADQLVAEVTYETTDATIDSQVSQVIDSGADVFMLIATPQFAIQGIQRTAALGFEGTKIVTSVSSSVGAVIEPAGRDVATDWVTSVYLKDPTDPQYDEDPGMMQYQEILAEYAPDANPDDGFNVYGLSVAQLFQHTLESMPTLCRAAVMEAAKNLDWAEAPLLIDGISVRTGEGDAFPIQQVQLQRWNGEVYEKFGEIIDAAEIND